MADKDKNIHSGHRKRVKDNVGKHGFSHLEDHRLLELILYYSIPRDDTNPIAHRLLDEFGSLKNVFSADISELEKVNGVGANTALMLAAVGEACERSLRESPDKRRTYKTVGELKELAVSLLVFEPIEKIMVLCFDKAHHLRKCVCVNEGTADHAEIDMKKIVCALAGTIQLYAVLIHNHPHGDAEPSAYDIDSTRTVAVTLRKLHVDLADHIIVGSDGSSYSMHSDPRFSAMFY